MKRYSMSKVNSSISSAAHTQKGELHYGGDCVCVCVCVCVCAQDYIIYSYTSYIFKYNFYSGSFTLLSWNTFACSCISLKSIQDLFFLSLFRSNKHKYLHIWNQSWKGTRHDRLPFKEELYNAVEICTCIHTKETMYGSSPMKRLASSVVLQGACDRHWNPPFIHQQSLNNMGPLWRHEGPQWSRVLAFSNSLGLLKCSAASIGCVSDTALSNVTSLKKQHLSVGKQILAENLVMTQLI